MMDFLNKSRNDSVGLFTNVLNLFICLITSSLILSCKEFSSILAPDNFQSSILITPIILFSTFFSFQDTIYQNYILYCKEKIYKISLITIFIGVLKVILNLILIPKFGYLSAGFSTLFCVLISLTIVYFQARNIYGDKIYNLKNIITPMLIIISSMAVFYLLNISQLGSNYVMLIKLLFFIGLISFSSRRIMRDLKNLNLI